MKKIIFGIIAAALLVTGSIFVIAQKSAKKEGGEYGRGHGHRGPGGFGGLGFALRGLDLTDEQKTKVKEIMETSKATAQPIMEQTRANHDKLRELGKAGAFDQPQVEALALAQGDLTAKMIVEKEKARSQVFALLTDEQKAKLETLKGNFEERSKGRKAKFAKPAEEVQ